ncbi:MAG TPA: Hsp20/alpha crystallin family protein [Phycisphaerae bacterium]|nr:Hsp20/alpha crystallin family protein [Phycisphaerales bacterium]HRX84474.1 Hsp20/alpha crystallin family protein [Phycisphaerae bacterium]
MGTLEDSFRELARTMDAMIDGVMGPDYFCSSARDTWDPPLNVYEMDDKLVVCVELAGIQPGDLDIQVDRNVLHIRGHRNKPAVPDVSGELSVHLMEINSGKFHRKIPVSSDLDVDACSASYKNGYVWIVMPRRSAEERP